MPGPTPIKITSDTLCTKCGYTQGEHSAIALHCPSFAPHKKWENATFTPVYVMERATSPHHRQTVEEMMQAEIDDLRLQVKNLRAELAKIGESCKSYLSKTDDDIT